MGRFVALKRFGQLFVADLLAGLTPRQRVVLRLVYGEEQTAVVARDYNGDRGMPRWGD